MSHNSNDCELKKITFPNSLKSFRTSKICFFTVIIVDLEGAGIKRPPTARNAFERVRLVGLTKLSTYDYEA